MTGPGPIAQPPAEMAEVIGSAVKQLALDPQAYGISWRLRIATVINADPLYVLFDGDPTGDPLRAESMTGLLLTAARVYVITIPPGGNFVISYVDDPFAVDTNTQTCTDGQVAATVGAETAIPTASYDSQPLFVFKRDSLYRLTFNGCMYSSSGAAVSAVVRIRQGAASTSGNLVGFSTQTLTANAATLVESKIFMAYCKNITSADITSYLSLTVAITVGTQVAFFANSDVPLILEKQLIGSASAYAALAAVARSVS